MKFIKNAIIKILGWANDDRNVHADISMENIKTTARRKDQSSLDGMNGMNFTIYTATGGLVVQIRQYDPIRDQSDNRLYIVSDREDLGQELGHIITREKLAR